MTMSWTLHGFRMRTMQLNQVMAHMEKMNWVTAIQWAENLEYYDTIRGATWSDWRLPKILPLNGSEYDYNYSAVGAN